MKPLAYYAAQSPFSNPGRNVGLFAGLPSNIDSLCRVVRGLCIHYFTSGEEHGYELPKERLSEVDTRYVERMLDRIHELDERPLIEPRPPERRLAGCCRDFAVMLCSMARHHGIPARVRVGFATYFNDGGPGFSVSHEIVELWDSDKGRWRLVDPELGEQTIQKHCIELDAHDVPRDRFLVAGKAWQMCRTGEADPNRFGIEDMSGLWFIRGNLVLDLAALNRSELLLWDNWGLMSKDMEAYTEEEWQLLDKVAAITQASSDAFAEMRTVYEGEVGLKVPSVVTCHSPTGKTSEVTLASPVG